MKMLRISLLLALVIAFFGACQKEYSIEGGVVSLLPGSWEFKDSTKLFSGNMDTAFIETSGSTKTLRLQGTSFSGTEDFEIILNTTASAFTVGTYSASSGEVNFEYSNNSLPIYQGNQLFGEFIVNITAISATNVTGSFTGLAEDSVGVIKTIKEGKFTSRYSGGSSTGGGVATGVLGVTAGICVPTTSSGTYTQGVALSAANTIEVTVNVATLGTYNLTTNTVNGVSFTKTGSFTTLGVQTVLLVGSGVPTNAGDSTYRIAFGTSSCDFRVTYAPGAPPATGTLGATAGACTPVTNAGNYVQGLALTVSNTVTVTVNVLTAGSYNIATSTANGVSFSKSGIFTVTGPQTVVLNGTGIPTASGAHTFTVTFNTSTCTFPITFVSGTPTGDYLPLTANSNWIYYGASGLGFPDSFKITSTGLVIPTGGNSYTRFLTDDLTTAAAVYDTTYFRKTPNNYFEFMDVSDLFNFDNPVPGDVNFLRDNVATNGTWNSQNFSGTVGGVPFQGFFKFTILSQAQPATVGSTAFPDVIKVKAEAFYVVAPTTPLFSLEQWFARGVGLVKIDFAGIDNASINRFQVF